MPQMTVGIGPTNTWSFSVKPSTWDVASLLSADGTTVRLRELTKAHHTILYFVREFT